MYAIRSYYGLMQSLTTDAVLGAGFERFLKIFECPVDHLILEGTLGAAKGHAKCETLFAP